MSGLLDSCFGLRCEREMQLAGTLVGGLLDEVLSTSKIIRATPPPKSARRQVAMCFWCETRSDRNYGAREETLRRRADRRAGEARRGDRVGRGSRIELRPAHKNVLDDGLGRAAPAARMRFLGRFASLETRHLQCPDASSFCKALFD